jgi:hypothetical protein
MFNFVLLFAFHSSVLLPILRCVACRYRLQRRCLPRILSERNLSCLPQHNSACSACSCSRRSVFWHRSQCDQARAAQCGQRRPHAQVCSPNFFLRTRAPATTFFPPVSVGAVCCDLQTELNTLVSSSPSATKRSRLWHWRVELRLSAAVLSLRLLVCRSVLSLTHTHTHILVYCRISNTSAHAFAAAIVALMPDLIQVTFLINLTIIIAPSLSHQHMIFESSSLGDTSCDCLALLAALDSQGFQGQLQGAVTAQQQRAHTLGLQQETHSQVPQVFRRQRPVLVTLALAWHLFFSSLSGHVGRICCCGCCAQLQCHGIQSELGQEGL